MDIPHLAEAAVAEAVAQLTDDMPRRGHLPDPAFTTAVASVTAERLAVQLAEALPLDGARTRALCETLLAVLLGAMVGALRAQSLTFAATLRAVAQGAETVAGAAAPHPGQRPLPEPPA